MKFNKKKFNFIVCFVLILISAAVAFAGISSNVGKISADNEALEFPMDDLFDSSIGDETSNEDSTNNEESSGSQNGSGQSSTVENAKTLKFTNAWEAYYYALDLSKTTPCYEVNTQTIKAESTSLPVKVFFKETKYVANKLSEVALVNVGATVFDVSIITIEPDGPYTTYAYYNFDKQYGSTHREYMLTMDQIREKEPILQYEIPYVLNEQTADAQISCPPKKDYYEIKMTLKPSSWKNYKKTLMKALEGYCKEEPTVNSATITIRIDKKTGLFKSYQSNESFIGTVSYESLNAEVEGTGCKTIQYYYNSEKIERIYQTTQEHLAKPPEIVYVSEEDFKKMYPEE